MDVPDPRRGTLRRALSALALLAAGALVAVLVLQGRTPAPRVVYRPGPLPADIAARIAALPGMMDSHPDADVGRVLLPGMDGTSVVGVPVHTNADGMRDSPLVSPKPKSTARIVLLGDSFVFGWGVVADERLGAVLQRELSARVRSAHAFDVRHVAVPSWSAWNAVAYARRRLSLLEADLVVLVLGPNDLDDGAGVRGFGELATFDPAHPGRADSRVYQAHAAASLGSDRLGLLPAGLDHESRERWASVADSVARLQRDVSATGGTLRVLMQFGLLNPVARAAMDDLDARLFLWMPVLFSDAPENRLSADDWHWSATAHAEIARLLFGVIRSQHLLPYEIEIGGWPESGAAIEALHRKGLAEVETPISPERVLGNRVLQSALVFDERPLDPDAAAQVHGGIDRAGRLGPYAALVLRNDGARRLVVRISGLGRLELPAVAVRIELDEVLLHPGEPALAHDDHWTLSFDIPDALVTRAHLGVRFLADDWVAAPEDGRHAIVARLHEVALRE